MASTENICGVTCDLAKSSERHQEQTGNLKEKIKHYLKLTKYFFQETTVEPSLFIFQLCTALSSLTVQNMHIEKSCKVYFRFGDVICDNIIRRNTSGLEEQVQQVQTLVSSVVSWKFPLQTGIPAFLVLFVGAWSDKFRKRKVCILTPIFGEILVNIGLLLATYFFYELSLTATVLIEALPSALTGSYIIMFMGMYCFMTDITSVENRTFRLGVVSICINLGTPTGTALSGILLSALGYYGMFSLILSLHALSFVYGMFRLEDVCVVEDNKPRESERRRFMETLRDIFGLVSNTILVMVKRRPFNGRTQVFLVVILYFIMVGPLYGDSTVGYLYAIYKFGLNEVEYSIYGAVNFVIGLVGTFFCISFLSKKLKVQDSIIGILACVSRIASSLAFCLAPSRMWYYSAAVFNIFSYTSLTAVRSIATKIVPTDEIAKLSAILGVSEALAPSIYMPTSSHIYASTIDHFPGAFYLFDVAVTLIGLSLFCVVYVLVKRKLRDSVTDPAKKEEFARTNEISHF